MRLARRSVISPGVEDIYGTCDKLAKEGVKILRPAGPSGPWRIGHRLVEDPDGYKIELVQK